MVLNKSPNLLLEVYEKQLTFFELYMAYLIVNI